MLSEPHKLVLIWQKLKNVFFYSDTDIHQNIVTGWNILVAKVSVLYSILLLLTFESGYICLWRIVSVHSHLTTNFNVCEEKESNHCTIHFYTNFLLVYI